MPLLIKDVGEEEFLRRVEEYTEVLELGSQVELRQRSIKHIVEWAEEQIASYQNSH